MNDQFQPIPPLRACALYSTGHTVHWIQALHSANKPETAAAAWHGRIIDLTGEVLTVRRRLTTMTYRNHDLGRLAAVVERYGSRILINDQYAILRVDHGSGAYCFSLRPDDGWPLEPCS